MNIHLIEKKGLLKMINIKEERYESGFWRMSEDIARNLIKGNIYFHKRQTEPSFLGGVILSYRIHNEEGEYFGRIVFTFQAMIGHKNVKTGREGWRREMKIEH